MFENSFTAGARRREVAHRLGALPVALAIHALVLGFVLVTQLWAVGEVVEPYTVVSFYSPPPPPPPARRPPADGPRQPTHRTITHQTEMAPATVPAESAKPATREETTDYRAVDDGDPDATVDGVPWSLGDGTTREVVPPPASEGETPRVISPEMQAPVAIFRPAPAYPELARRVRRQGMVVLQATIDRRGNVVDVRVLRDAGLGLAEAAVEAVRTWRYAPATLAGQAVAVYLTVTVNFELNGAG